MQSTRFLAANMLRQQAATSALLRSRASPMLRAQPTRSLRMQATPRMMAVPKEQQSAHTISQRLRTLKRVPPELVPLAVVLAVAIIAAVYSMGHKLMVDKTLRLTRQGPQGNH